MNSACLQTKQIPVILLLMCVCCLQAQNIEFGGIFGVEYERELKRNFHLSVESEAKIRHNFTDFHRLKAGAGLNYAFWNKRIKIDGMVNYLLAHKKSYYENRCRINVSLSYTERIRRWKLSYRIASQFLFYQTQKSEHPYNPKIYLRNKLRIEYKFVNQPVNLYLSTEFFWRMYKNYVVDKWRTVLGVTYRINKQHHLDFYLQSDNEVQVKKRDNIFSAGVAYSFKH
ncbi:MAG: DUF2490 domain-containing protein [Bacteroidales bacterium]|nr:DUF2490 domain-containing protein [Bacteroidales bacterium]